MDMLGLLEGLEALAAELPSQTGLLEAAKGAGVVVGQGSLNQTVPAFTSRMQRRMVLKSTV